MLKKARTCFLVPVDERQGAVIKRVAPLGPRSVAQVHLEQQTGPLTPWPRHASSLSILLPSSQHEEGPTNPPTAFEGGA